MYGAKLLIKPEPGFYIGRRARQSRRESVSEMRRSQIKVDLTVFYSTSYKEPTREKNERKFEAP